MTLKIIPALTIAVLVLFAFYLVSQPQTAQANIWSGTVISAATTSTSFSVTVSARILATTTNTVGTGYTRVFASICNPSSNPVYLNMNQDKAATTGNVTAVIAAAAGYQACYEVTDRNMYSGSITASSTNETATRVNVQEFVQ